MKQVGVDIWSGLDPYTLAAFRSMQSWKREEAAKEKKDLEGLAPCDRFRYLARKKMKQPMRLQWPNFYTLGDSLIEMHPVAKGCFTDLDCGEKFVWHLRSIYTVDTCRQNGAGKNVLQAIKELAEQSGAIVILFVSKFALRKPGEVYGYSAFSNMKELVKASLIDEYEVVYFHDWENEHLEKFYIDQGFQNACLANDCSIHGDMSGEHWNEHFIYVPSTVEADHLHQIQHRLNPRLCEFCK